MHFFDSRERVLKTASKVALTLTGSLLALAAAVPAMAQAGDGAPAAEGSSADIIVTAQFREQNLQDTPIAITAVTAESIAAKSQSSIVEVAGAAPNVTLTPAGAGFGNSATASIRGVGQTDFNFALEPGVGMYLDDVYYGVLFGANFDVADVERVEVLRGPQGTLAGKNSIGGAIKLFSQKPGPDTDAYVEATYGRFNRVDVKAATNITLLDDKLYARISGMTKNRGGYFKEYDFGCVTGGTATGNQRLTEDCVIGKEGGQEVYAVRGQLRWLATDTIENNLAVDFAKDSSPVQATKLISAGPWAQGDYITGPESYSNFATFTGHPGTADAFTIPRTNSVESWGISNNLDIKLTDNLALKSITAFRRAEGEFSADLDVSPDDVQTIFNAVSHRQFSQELRLSGEIGDLVEWTIGGYYYDARQTIAGRKDIPGGILPGGGGLFLEFLDDDVIKSDNKSGFAHVVVHPTAAMSIIGGLRYSKETKSYTFSRRSADGSPHPLLGALDGFTGDYSGDRWDYRLGLQYEWSPTFMTYVQTSTGFKGGGVNPRPFFAEQVQPFNPETLTAYEVGFKSRLLDRAVTLNGALFYNRYKDIQMTALSCDQFSPFPGAPCALPVNAGNATVKGAELETTIIPVDGLTIDGAVSYLDFDYTFISTDAGIPGVLGVQDGMVTPYTPEWKASAGIQYEIPAPGGTITPRLDWNYQSKAYTNFVNEPDNVIKWGSRFNAKLTYRNEDNDWEVALAVTNLTNKFYYLNKFDTSSPPFFVVTGQPARPREWSVSVKKAF